ERLVAEVINRHSHQRPGQRRHHRRDDDALDVVQSDLMVVAQVGDDHAELIGRPLPARGDAPAVNQLPALERADDDVGVADIEGQEDSHRTSPPIMRSMPVAVVTRSAPVVSTPAVVPVMTPPGVSHSTVVPAADGAAMRHSRRMPSVSSDAMRPNESYRHSSAAASRAPRSTARPSSASIEVARRATSGGYDAGRRLRPMPMTTVVT